MENKIFVFPLAKKRFMGSCIAIPFGAITLIEPKDGYCMINDMVVDCLFEDIMENMEESGISFVDMR